MNPNRKEVSYLRPLPLNERPSFRPQPRIDGTSALVVKPQVIEIPKLELIPKTPYEKPHFKALSPARQRKLRRGVMLGFVLESTLETSEGTHKVDSDSAAAQHEVLHWAALAGLENAGHGVTRIGMSVKPSSDYRAVTWFAINPNIPRADQAWILLVAALGSGAPDNLDYGYTHAGRGSDEGQANYAAKVISMEKYKGRVSPAAIKAEAREVAHAYAKDYTDESTIWRLTRDEAA